MVRFPERNNRLIDKVRSVAIVRVLYRKSSHRIVTQTQRRSFLLRASPCLVFGRAHLSLPNAVRGELYSIKFFVHPCARRPFHYRSEIAPDNRHIHLQSTSDKKTAISERKLLPGGNLASSDRHNKVVHFIYQSSCPPHKIGIKITSWHG